MRKEGRTVGVDGKKRNDWVEATLSSASEAGDCRRFTSTLRENKE
jgi:hypothetical protein